MKRLTVFALILMLGYAPVAFADGPLVTSAKRAAQQLAKAEQPVTVASPGSAEVAFNSASAAAQGGDSGWTSTKTWIAVGLAGLFAVSVFALQDKTENTTPSALGTREDGCSFLC